MNRKATSLRTLAEKWLPMSAANPARVVRFGHTHARRVPYVCVAVQRADALLSIVFFRHRDGGWYVFPPMP